MDRNTARLRKRGFNQAILLAHYFRKNLIDHVHPIYPYWLRRTHATRPQTGLSLAERLVNQDDAFAASPEVQNRSILLLDNAAARCLLESKASRVGALVLCRRMWDASGSLSAEI